VKGFTEALINDFRINAPHVGVSLVMPGHIGTSIVINSGRILGREPKELPDDQLAEIRDRMEQAGLELEGATNDDIRNALQARAESFRDDAPMTAADAATVILDGVRKRNWRILVGQDAVTLDRMVRENPDQAYEIAFMEKFLAQSGWSIGG
jgi:hypothetical protein